MTTVLIVEDEPTPRQFLEKILVELDYEVIAVENLALAQEQIDADAAEIVLLDVKLPDGNGLALLEQLSRVRPEMPVIVLTGFGDIDMAVEAIHIGAADFIGKPVDAKRLQRSLKRATAKVSLQRELELLRRQRFGDLDWVESQAPAMRAVSTLIERAAPSNANVLLIGETGTGKEYAARAIQQLSQRAANRFIAVSCAEFPEHLIETELFGHEPHAFTGAAPKRKKGIIEVADGGTLFLDEIATLKQDMQPKLLRMLEERIIRRVGGTTDVKVDIRLITASSQDLRAMVDAGEFRPDLYYRLNVLEIQLPPLRERTEDIPAFVGAFLRRYGPENGKNIRGVQPLAMEALLSYPWPGNIRQLRNVIEHATLFCDGEEIQVGHLPAELQQYAPTPARILQPVG
ncbi:MAG: sigma-54-dependent transcriptional regulator [Anaerolineales bacterium]